MVHAEGAEKKVEAVRSRDRGEAASNWLSPQKRDIADVKDSAARHYTSAPLLASLRFCMNPNWHKAE